MQSRPFLTNILAAASSLLAVQAQAATFDWANFTGFWGTPASWAGGVVPTGTNPADVLVFGGDVGSVSTSVTIWTATNNLAAVPFQLNQLVITSTDANPLTSGLSHTIEGNALRFAGASPQLQHNGTASVTINNPVQFSGALTFGGTGAGRVTLNNAISGLGDITKTGSSEMRFGTFPVPPATVEASGNTWVGKLIIQSGAVRFNNNAQSAATALRANPVVFTGPGSLSAKRDTGDENNNYDTSLRLGTVSGNTGAVFGTIEGPATANFDIVITALSEGTFGGSIVLPAPSDPAKDTGKFIVRGTNTQTLTGPISIFKDVVVGRGATLVLANNASLGEQTKGAITFTGGTVVLDNTNGNYPTTGRLRDADAGSTTVETIGGGTLRIIGNALGTSELTGRLQLGAYAPQTLQTKERSGHLNIQLVHTAGGGGATNLRFQSYVRDQQTLTQLSTVNFSATNLAGTTLNLGQSATNSPHIFLSGGVFVPPITNGLLSTTGGSASVGWATVNGSDFAAYDTANGVAAVTTTNWTTSLPQSPPANALITGNASTPASNYIVNSIKISPVSAGGALNISGNGHLVSTAFLLTGAIDFAINASFNGGIAGNSPRFFHVQQATLTVNASLSATQQAVVKSGEGTLVLTNATNAGLITDAAITAINGGILRATPGTSLPGGEIRLRGGQLEIVGGGTFNAQVGFGPGGLNWSGVRFDPNAGGPGIGANVEVNEDRGSGGFAAFGADVDIDLNAGGPTLLSWEDLGFIRSGHSLVFGSRSATHRVTWTDNLGLSDLDPSVINYNARDVRVLDNPGSTGDWARIAGSISGRQTNDLLKSGPGTLELTGVNTYAGATIVQEGTLLVNGDSQASYLHHVLTGATLGGNGIIGEVLVAPGGKLAPGKSGGLASVLRTRNLNFADATSQLLVEIGGPTPGGDVVTGYDQLIVTGTVALNDADLTGSFLNGYLPNEGDLFFIILNDGADAVQGTFSDGGLLSIAGNFFEISYTANSDSTEFTGGNDVALRFIPEPSSLLLLGLGALVGVRRRRN